MDRISYIHNIRSSKFLSNQTLQPTKQQRNTIFAIEFVVRKYDPSLQFVQVRQLEDPDKVIIGVRNQQNNNSISLGVVLPSGQFKTPSGLIHISKEKLSAVINNVLEATFPKQ